uniref:Uncharacterized protein n=1 Tax=Arundo donax TaxID=35708 RepID=A0A0A9AGI1_ARUDO
MGPPDPQATNLTSSSPTPERSPVRWKKSRRSLFHGYDAASLHRRAEKHRSPSHPRPNQPSEAEGIGVLAGGSTPKPSHPPFRLSLL